MHDPRHGCSRVVDIMELASVMKPKVFPELLYPRTDSQLLANIRLVYESLPAFVEHVAEMMKLALQSATFCLLLCVNAEIMGVLWRTKGIVHS